MGHYCRSTRPEWWKSKAPLSGSWCGGVEGRFHHCYCPRCEEPLDFSDFVREMEKLRADLAVARAEIEFIGGRDVKGIEWE